MSNNYVLDDSEIIKKQKRVEDEDIGGYLEEKLKKLKKDEN